MVLLRWQGYITTNINSKERRGDDSQGDDKGGKGDGGRGYEDEGDEGGDGGDGDDDGGEDEVKLRQKQRGWQQQKQ